MVGQYPDSMEIRFKPVPYQDESNNWVQPEGETVVVSECRASALSAMGAIKTQSGYALKHDYLVCCPKLSVHVPVGAKARITRHDGLVIENTVKRARNNRFNSNIWV